jgi:hypothetical protein
MAIQSFNPRRLGVIGVKDPTLGTAAPAGNIPTVALIGKTLGAVTTIVDEPVVRTHPALTDTLAQTVVQQILQISDSKGGNPNYVQNIDYSIAPNTNVVTWLGTVIPAPTGVAVAAAVTVGGALAANTYFYVITAIRQTALVPSPVTGETTKSAEVTVTIGGSFNSAKLTWTPVPGASGYKIYRSTTTGVYTNTLIVTVTGGASSSYTDVGATPGTGTPPVSNSANNRPADGVTYFVTYVAVITTVNQAKLYFSLGDVIADHSLQSDLVNAAFLIMGGVGVGQQAGQLMTVAVADYTEPNILAALTVLEGQDVDIIVLLDDNTTTQTDVAKHVIAMSRPDIGKPRMAFFGNARTQVIGDQNTSGTMVFKAVNLAALIDTDGNPQGYRFVYVSNQSINVNEHLANGTILTAVYDGWYLAAAVAGLVAVLPDRATSASFKQLDGIISLGVEFNISEQNFLDQMGLSFAFTKGTAIRYYHDRTLATDTVENSERAIVMADDFIDITLTTAFASNVGQKITPGFLSSLVTKTDQQLGFMLKAGILSSYVKSSITATPDQSNPTRVFVTFTYTPQYSANQIVFRRAYNLQPVAA